MLLNHILIPRRHFLMASIKWILLILAILLGATLFYYTHQKSEQNKGDTHNNPLLLAFPQMQIGEQITNAMLKPDLRGIDNKGQPYTISAESAVREGERILHLQQVKATVHGNGARIFVLHAERGVLDMTSHDMTLDKGVTVRDDSGLEAHTPIAYVTNNASTVLGEQPIEIKTSSSDTLYAAGGFKIEHNGAFITFYGPVKAVIHLNKSPSPSPSS